MIDITTFQLVTTNLVRRLEAVEKREAPRVATVFNVLSYLRDTETIATNAVPAIQRAYVALLAAGGGVLYFPAGLYVCNDVAQAAVIGITRDNSRSRGLTYIHLDAGATVRLSTNTRRFIDFVKIADHDLFYNLLVEGGTIDANNIGGQHHIVIGTYQAGTAQSRISLDRITVRNLRVINALNDAAVGTNHRLHVWLAVRHPGSNEGTQDTITNIAMRDLDLQGGNAGIGINGQVDAGSQANVSIDNVLIENCRHDCGATPAISAPYASSNFQVGSQGFIGKAVLRDCWGARAGDTGIEVNGGLDVEVDNCRIDDSAGPAIYIDNYYSLADTNHTIRGCEVRWTAVWEISGVSGMNHQGVAWAGNNLGAITVKDFVYRSAGATYSRNTSGALGGLAISGGAAVARLTIDNVRTFINTYTADNSGFANPLLVALLGTAQIRVRDLALRWTGTHPGAGTWTPRYLAAGAGTIYIDIEGLRFYEDWGASVGSGNIRAVQLGASTNDVISGCLRGLFIERLSDDTSPSIVHLLGGTGATFDARFIVSDCNFAAATAGTEVDCAQANEVHKIVYGPNIWRSATITGSTLFTGSGAPNNLRGQNGDYYFRTDTPGTVNQRLYVRSAGAWVALL